MLKDICGQTFGQLQVVCLSDKVSNGGERQWVCECSCGRIVHVRGWELRSGKRTCCTACKTAPAREAAAERARLKETELRTKQLERVQRALEKEAEAAAKKALKVSYEPKTDCRAYAGDRCAGLLEMFCRTRGECKFYKSKDTNRQDSP